MKNKGLHTHRFKEHPEEKRIAVAWERQNVTGRTLDYLLDGTPFQGGTPVYTSDRDREVAATVIQWLGSPVGQGWLRDLGYRRQE